MKFKIMMPILGLVVLVLAGVCMSFKSHKSIKKDLDGQCLYHIVTAKFTCVNTAAECDKTLDPSNATDQLELKTECQDFYRSLDINTIRVCTFQIPNVKCVAGSVRQCFDTSIPSPDCAND